MSDPQQANRKLMVVGIALFVFLELLLLLMFFTAGEEDVPHDPVLQFDEK